MSRLWVAVILGGIGTFSMRASFLMAAHRMADVPPLVAATAAAQRAECPVAVSARDVASAPSCVTVTSADATATRPHWSTTEGRTRTLARR